MIKKLIVKNLFDQFDYSINFLNDGITILTGPNGFGKSTILRIIETIGEKDLYDLYQFPFKEIVISTINNEIHIEKIDNGLYVNGYFLELLSRREIENYERRREISYVEMLNHDTFFDIRSDKIITRDEYERLLSEKVEVNEITDRLIFANYERAKIQKKERNKFKELQKFINSFRKDIGDIKFIKEQRLLRRETVERGYYNRNDKTKIVEVINEIPGKLMEQIKFRHYLRLWFRWLCHLLRFAYS